MINIRHFTAEDYPMVDSWWKAANEPTPYLSMLPPETTFVMEMDNTPTSAICLYLTNCSELCYLDNFISNPAMKSPARHEANKQFLSFIKEFSLAHGYKNVLAFAVEDKLKSHYEKLGMRKTLKNLDSFVLEGRQ